MSKAHKKICLKSCIIFLNVSTGLLNVSLCSLSYLTEDVSSLGFFHQHWTSVDVVIFRVFEFNPTVVVWNRVETTTRQLQIRKYARLTLAGGEILISNLVGLMTHMGWRLCSGSNSGSLEVLPLCREIHWLGYGSPARDQMKKGSGKWGVSDRCEAKRCTCMTYTDCLIEAEVSGRANMRKRSLVQYACCD